MLNSPKEKKERRAKQLSFLFIQTASSFKKSAWSTPRIQMKDAAICMQSKNAEKKAEKTLSHP